jgi:hypothetical protein
MNASMTAPMSFHFASMFRSAALRSGAGGPDY